MLNTEFAVMSTFKLLPLALTLLLTFISLVLSESLAIALISFKFSRIGYNVFSFLNQRFLIELFYNKYLTNIIFKLGAQTTKFLDKGSVELIGPLGLEKTLLNISRNIANLDTGLVTSYALYILIGLLFYMLIPYFTPINTCIILLILLSLNISLQKDPLNTAKFYFLITKSIICNLDFLIIMLYLWLIKNPVKAHIILIAIYMIVITWFNFPLYCMDTDTERDILLGSKEKYNRMETIHYKADGSAIREIRSKHPVD